MSPHTISESDSDSINEMMDIIEDLMDAIEPLIIGLTIQQPLYHAVLVALRLVRTPRIRNRITQGINWLMRTYRIPNRIIQGINWFMRRVLVVFGIIW